ncbi:hypothetical protein [Labilibacter marinus]|uniref:hypothetical protein n=1 Tax=Labilibacter marinus TaxID=1477105 RepID=UPI0009502BC7|nr:hypothetical protein [Labilibacter marinus]
MNSTADKQHIETELENICQHKLFANSPSHIRLLKYLIDKAYAGDELKEYTIGTELYGINYAEDKSNGTVRSYFYKLRKKLEQYYSDSSLKHEVYFEIKKGQYNLSFSSAKEYPHQLSSSKDYLKISYKSLKYSALGLIFIIALSAGIYKMVNQPLPLWEGFFSKNAQNIIVVSDQYVINEQLDDEKWHAVFYEEINNHDDFLTHLKQYPNRKMKTVDYTVMSKMAPYGVGILSKWFTLNNSDYSIEMESKITAADVYNSNIIFIGQFKTMNISSSLFLKKSKVFSTFHDGFKYKNKDTTLIYNTTHGKNGKIEYAMVASSVNNNGKPSIYFVSNNDIGVMATVNKFTNKKWLKEFYQQIPKHTIEFNALFKVEGLKRTDISCELVELEVIE